MEYKDTLNLPKTDFPIRPNAKVDDPALIARWEKESLYTQAMSLNKGSDMFLLHIGPPYANGNIHLGHAYNGILKDIVSKSYRMAGSHVPVRPGWDCHGLPIEIKVTTEQPGLSGVALKTACRAYATKWVDVQRDGFKRLGIVMEWDRPYLTMSPEYESRVVEAFLKLSHAGFIERKLKSVAWCASCKTTLASAEIEYEDRKDPSLYVAMQFDNGTLTKIFWEKTGLHAQEPVFIVIWTTTPWTLPLNRAVSIKEGAFYTVARCKDRAKITKTCPDTCPGDAFNNQIGVSQNSEGYKIIVVGSARYDAFNELLGGICEKIAEIPFDMLKGAQLQHLYDTQRRVPVIIDSEVSLTDGTASVHIAPGCGPSDYELGVKNNLEIYSPLSDEGRYTAGIKPESLEGMSFIDAQIWVIKDLAARGLLLFKNSIKHSYPHCWRCHNGLMFRATPQWFFDLKKNAVQDRALAAINDIEFNPKGGQNFLRATVETRWEWCLSRQRIWGVPIVALVCEKCGHGLVDKAMGAFIVEHIAKEGIEFWDKVSIEELFKHIESSHACSHCSATTWRKESDILDVWFESGLSHYAVLKQDPTLGFPAQLYLEGIDQHRGWFQSSLLTAIALYGQAPMEGIMTHGFTVDEQGRKMSKSLGNVVNPQDVVDKIGTDGLRLWVASIGNDGDAVMSQKLLDNVTEVYRKIRNTMRFLLQNLYDYQHERDAVAVKDLMIIDQYALTRLNVFNERMLKAYSQYDSTALYHGFAEYCTVELSSLYLDVVKDRLYTETAGGVKRRSTQTVIWYILDTLTRLSAPILSCTAELVADQYQQPGHPSIHLQGFRDVSGECAACRNVCALEAVDILVRDMRPLLLRALEVQRASGAIKHSLEASIHIYLAHDSSFHAPLKDVAAYARDAGSSIEAFIQELLIVSDVVIESAHDDSYSFMGDGVYVRVDHAAGGKCPRCWQWTKSAKEDLLCDRCAEIITSAQRLT